MHVIKRGDTPRLRWSLDRDLTGTESATLRVRPEGGSVSFSRAMVIDDMDTGIVAYKMLATDWGPGKFETDLLVADVYKVEVETVHPTLGTLTHPSVYSPEHDKIVVQADLE